MNLDFNTLWNDIAYFVSMYGIIALVPICMVVTAIMIWYFNPINSMRLRWTPSQCCVRFCELTGKNYTVIDSLLISLKDDQVTRDAKTYVLDYTRSIKDSSGRSYLFFDIDTILPLTTAQTTEHVENKEDKGDVVLGTEPDNLTPTLKYTIGKDNKPLLWYNPSALDASLYFSIMFNTVWSEIGRSRLEKFALYIIVALVIGIGAIAALGAWQINSLSIQNAELTQQIIEILTDGGAVTGG